MLRLLVLLVSVVTAWYLLMWQRDRGHGPDRIYTLEMRSALRQIADAEAAHYPGTGTFAATLADLPDSITRYLPPVTVVIDHADANTWQATARSDLITRSCVISGRQVEDRHVVSGPVCTGEYAFTPLYDSVRAGLAPRHEFKRWLAAP